MNAKAKAEAPSTPTRSKDVGGWPRGSGRTARGIAATADGGIYVVHNRSFTPYCQDLLVSLGREPNSLRFVTLDDIDVGAIDGFDGERCMDHYAFDVATKDQVLRVLRSHERPQAAETTHG